MEGRGRLNLPLRSHFGFGELLKFVDDFKIAPFDFQDPMRCRGFAVGVKGERSRDSFVVLDVPRKKFLISSLVLAPVSSPRHKA